MKRIYFGHDYEIERYIDDCWQHVSFPSDVIVVPDILYSLKLGRKVEFEQAILSIPSEPGLYRVIKEVSYSNKWSKEDANIITAEFTVSTR